MADFIQALDPSKLVLAGTFLAFIISPFTVPVYNLPLLLFGVYTQENAEAAQSIQAFSALLGVSALYDLGFIFKVEQGFVLKLAQVVLLLLKIPTFVTFAAAIRQRGGGHLPGGLGNFGGLGSNDVSGPTVWQMPGGFAQGGRDGYQTVDDPPAQPAATRPPPPPAPAPSQQAPAGGYQTV
ncbi:hypothetical protein PENSPDRAFT_730397 [Peniophora sp. CONT]|nr:hypothetical protein PENSPDRAFT_730397 [Peniophora sp. CONT]